MAFCKVTLRLQHPWIFEMFHPYQALENSSRGRVQYFNDGYSDVIRVQQKSQLDLQAVLPTWSKYETVKQKICITVSSFPLSEKKLIKPSYAHPSPYLPSSSFSLSLSPPLSLTHTHTHTHRHTHTHTHTFLVLTIHFISSLNYM